MDLESERFYYNIMVIFAFASSVQYAVIMYSIGMIGAEWREELCQTGTVNAYMQSKPAGFNPVFYISWEQFPKSFLRHYI